MAEFDLERAKAGEPIQRKFFNEWNDCKFVGQLSSGEIALEEKGVLFRRDASDIRMAPRKKTWYCRVFVDMTGTPELALRRRPGELDNDWERPWHGKEFTVTVDD